jgi:hypothetical protein
MKPCISYQNALQRHAAIKGLSLACLWLVFGLSLACLDGDTSSFQYSLAPTQLALFCGKTAGKRHE